MNKILIYLMQLSEWLDYHLQSSIYISVPFIKNIYPYNGKIIYIFLFLYTQKYIKIFKSLFLLEFYIFCRKNVRKMIFKNLIQ